MSTRLMAGTILIAVAIIATSSQAFEFRKPLKTTILTTKTDSHSASAVKKDVYLMDIKLSDKERTALFSVNPKNSHGYRSSRQDLPASVNLGMNNVPVLDQGRHGTCATFATTAAVDAALGKGDYISQLCQLELGASLENSTYMPSGWSGSFGPWVLEQMMRYGIVSQDNQKIKSCAGERQYPTSDLSEGNPISVDEFREMSEDLHLTLYPTYLLSMYQRFDAHFSDTDQAERALIQAKETLADGNRLTFGVFVIISDYCSAGACATYHTAEDTWALTKEIETPPYGTAGHEMVIIGYDDNAVAIDREGKKHQGLLTLRNSWGVEAGDHGNYYMSYDYFKKFVIELQGISVLKSEF
ncbi:MAG: C1 family peptidase [Gammaproteobacteria bacterium]|nr:C1 family peptidase [Gammaproteobacteria bacterium]